jgi:hypothetical protein
MTRDLQILGIIIGIIVFTEVIGVISLKPTLHPEVDEIFRLTKGDTAAIEEAEITVTVTGFANSPCPEEITCISSGQNVFFDSTYKGDPIEYGTEIPYYISIVESNYKTWAKFKVFPRE